VIFVDKVSPLTLLRKKAVTSHQESFAPQYAFSIRSSALAETLATSKMNTTITAAMMDGIFVFIIL
jgi:hypothetical protein